MVLVEVPCMCCKYGHLPETCSNTCQHAANAVNLCQLSEKIENYVSQLSAEIKKKKKNLGIACGTSWSHKKLKQIKLRYPWTAETSITKRTLDVRRIYSGT